MMRSKSVKPSLYPPVPFHTIRTIALLSSVIVGIILAVFIYHLKSGGYKLPWTFLVLLIAAILSLLNYVLTTITHTCHGLSPRLSLLSNTILLILWLISLGLLSWSMFGTILTSCTATDWVTATGISVCRTYKALFAFTCTGTIAAIAAVVLDVIVHKRQTRLGSYDPMTSTQDIKLHERNSSVMSGAGMHTVPPTGAGAVGPDDERAPLQYNHAHSHAANPYADADADIPGPDYANHSAYPAPPAVYGHASSGHYHAGEAREFSDVAPARSQPGGPRARFSGAEYPGYGNGNGNGNGYGHGYPAEQTGYDPGAYR
ncbi:uncharacterized protein ACLA_081770 [Aspergillus clavatus NRRL 1]|uniref:MARVEL domain-containing protein n=1 Tax=Aspergillus clavatus (strain ATCC 1007 / CBS 513.65 / DSM 816 / NCTC 3887 / NRRL 1 / QM 1276 / 107) TaxID=344612 RepID=A1CT50_ASPCL|nr:uncharacterized protein ACLA_081770 [Aspergillus clavatus NRRL 1]EAW06487.1 conserved hypothetical protein [Aspergillus clavatus NRRL 1]